MLPPRPHNAASRYVDVRSPAGIWRTRPECARAVQDGEADFLFGPDSGRRTAEGSGRGRMTRFRLAGLRVVGKRALHGGLLGPLLGGRYLGRRRADDQVTTAVRLEAADVPTPAIVAVGTAPVLGPLRAHVIVSRELESSRNLLELAASAPAPARRRVLLRLCADLIRTMHDAGFLHADLNVGNLVLEHGAAGEILHVVDLDGGRFLPNLSPGLRLRNLARLARSYEKWIVPKLRLTPREEILFLRRYARGDRRLTRRFARALEGHRSRMGLRMLLWGRAAALSKSRPADPLE